ncbi:MAG: MBL fold metallo-hydrolase [Candidatus Moraniibacteriota bacterium]
MKLVILGSGVCASQLPGIPNRFPPGFLVEWESERVLFDCSEGIRFRLEQAGYDYAAIEHVAVTHPHPDHYAFPYFYQSMCCTGWWGGAKSRGVTLYGPDQLTEDFPVLWKMLTPENDGKFFDLMKVHLRGMSSGKEVAEIGSGKLLAQPVYHGFGKTPAVSYRLETPEGIFAYSGDTGECEGVREVAHGADIFVCEASSRVGDDETSKEYGHLSPYLAGKIALEGGVKKLILVHYTGLDSDDAIALDTRRSGFVGDLVIGKDFMEFNS